MEIRPDFSRNLKQKKAIKLLFDHSDGSPEYILFGGAAGGSKLVENTGVVLTPMGWRLGKDLKVGDLINNPDGTVQRIIQVKPEVYLDRWNVYFSDGTMTSVGYDHLWLAWKNRKGRKIQNKRTFGEESAEVVETQELKKWLNRGYRPQIPVCSEQSFNVTNNEKNRINPYLLGVLIGDGCLTSRSVVISSHNKDISHYMQIFTRQDVVSGGGLIRIVGDRGKNIKEKLKLHGLWGKKSADKFIPKSYKWASINDRYAIIQGLMDTDGTSAKDKNTVYFTTVSRQLADDMAFVIRSLGGVVTISKNKSGYKSGGKYIECQDAYSLYIRHRNPDRLFRMNRKKHGVFGKNLVQKSIVDIKIEGKIRGRCISVSNPNGLYITNNFIVTHNSFTGCAWVILGALRYPGTRWVIGRSVLKNLKETTLVTFFEVCKKWGIKKNIHYVFNTKDNYIKFDDSLGGSLILLKDLYYYPSDPEFDSLGSLEITGAFVDEAAQVTKKAIEILHARIRYRLGDFCGYCGAERNTLLDKEKKWKCPVCKKNTHGLKAKLLMSCMPTKKWLYMDFYKPHTEERLSDDKIFIPALPQDNPYNSKAYLDNISNIEDEPTRQKYLGNWEYEEDEGQIMKYQDILKIFNNKHVPSGEPYATCDVARMGRDKTVLMIWRGWRVEKILIRKKTTLTEVMELIAENCVHIPLKNIIVDEEGLGGGIVDQMGVQGFVASRSPLKERSHRYKIKMNYGNLRAQCFWGLANQVARQNVYINTQSSDVRTAIVEELEQIKRKEQLQDGKFRIIPKKEIEEAIGRSPDFADCLAQRRWFELKKHRKFII